jgi:uncharacterized protein (TIGR00369 family)
MPRPPRVTPATRDPALFDAAGRELFPGLLGIVVTELEDTVLRAELALRPEHFAPNGFVHAGVLVTLADTAAGYGCVANLPPDAAGFTTLELKVSFLGAARSGTLRCEARAAHIGGTTQVWDATVTDDDGRTLALFRCTQLVLQPRRPRLESAP